jgi:hypothetical protein
MVRASEGVFTTWSWASALPGGRRRRERRREGMMVRERLAKGVFRFGFLGL